MNTLRRLHTLRVTCVLLLGACISCAAQPTIDAAQAGEQPLAYTDNSELHPNLARGWHPTDQVEAFDHETVNLFNGNLQTRIPIGLEYPVSARLSYQLALHYNSAVWDYRKGPSDVFHAARPVESSNAGLGWDLSLGRLIAPSTASSMWLYVGPDGSGHAFYQDLHWDTPDGDETILYTRDGSYLRLRPASATMMRVDSPDGTFREFQQSGSEWRLVRIAAVGAPDAITITYEANAWTLTDTQGRSQRTELTADPSGAYPALVSRIELSAFAGRTAVYRFEYLTASVARACADAVNGPVNVPLLNRIVGPDGTTETALRVLYELDYDTTGSCVGSGRLASMRLPSGGRHAFTYATTYFPQPFCSRASDRLWRSQRYLLETSMVATRSTVRPDGTVEGVWSLTATSTAASCADTERLVTVTSPLGDPRVVHYVVATRGNAAEYGLPGVEVPPALPNRPPQRLAEERFDCNADGSGCERVRRTFMEFEQDERCQNVFSNCFDTNRRLRGVRTVHDGVSENGVSTELSDYDGLGHYRQVIRGGSFPSTFMPDFPADERRTYTAWNASWGRYDPNELDGGSTFAAPVPADVWSFERSGFVEHRRINGTALDREDRCFDWTGHHNLETTVPLVAPATRYPRRDVPSVRRRGPDLPVRSRRSFPWYSRSHAAPPHLGSSGRLSCVHWLGAM